MVTIMYREMLSQPTALDLIERMILPTSVESTGAKRKGLVIDGRVRPEIKARVLRLTRGSMVGIVVKWSLRPSRQTVQGRSEYCVLPIPRVPRNFQISAGEEDEMFSRTWRRLASRTIWLHLFLANLKVAQFSSVRSLLCLRNARSLRRMAILIPWVIHGAGSRLTFIFLIGA